ncbi:MAG TPA: hypothetical protein VK927_03330 [Adhaeribacter sp.]|nr:hypothetical protein [Adhaeribacter sp.]
MPFRSVLKFLLPVFALFWLSGCEIINPPEDTPAYLQINKITVDPRKSATETYGSPSNNIVDAWVFANGKLLGAFELPATIPVLESGSVEIAVQAGVYSDGLSAARFPYGFYTQHYQTVDLIPGQVHTIEPVVQFTPSMKHPYDLYEDFTSFAGTGSLRVPASSPYTLEVNHDTLTNFEFANGAVGVIKAKAGETQPFVIESGTSIKLPANRKPVFLEVDYRTTVNFRIGLLAINNLGQTEPLGLVVVNASRDWKKIYVNLTSIVNNPQYSGASFRVFMEGTRQTQANDYMALDNVRILSLN